MSINKLKQILILFKKELEKSQINYALGGSLLLYFEGIETSVNDIDIIVDVSDHDKLQLILQKYHFKKKKQDTKYKTEHFYTITINGIDIDIMLGFKVITKHSVYDFPFNVDKTITINKESINLSSLDEWILAYHAMGRLDKVNLIERHLKFNIDSKRLYIRKVRYEDKTAMLQYMSDEETLFYERSAPFTIESMNDLLGEIVPSGSFYSVFLKETNIQVGHIYFGLGSPIDFKEFNIGYIMNKLYHNLGYCTEASKALIDYGFKNYDMHRVIAKCNPDNIASWKVMEKVGLLKEGHLKQRVCFKKDELGNPIWWDEYIYGITRNDWLKKSV